MAKRPVKLPKMEGPRKVRRRSRRLGTKTRARTASVERRSRAGPELTLFDDFDGLDGFDKKADFYRAAVESTMGAR